MAGALEHLERAAVQVVEGGVAEDLEAQTGTAPHFGPEIVLHWAGSVSP
jgi:hypothetical protein